jgi:hypothetical protein
MNKITEVTRRNIFDTIQLEKTQWNGRLDAPNFLSRIFDLSKLPSNDHRFPDAYGDIWKHTIMNDDWEDYWIFTDNRFNLLYCDDYIFLQFLCEMIHPIVRPELTEVNKLLQFFNDCLLADGFTIVEKMKISDKPVFIGRQILITNKSISQKNKKIVLDMSLSY